MERDARTALMALLTLLVLTFSGMGCSIPEAPAGDETPFGTDRVATVRIVMSEEDWTSCQLDALAERYVMADFWFDDELTPDVAVRPKGNSSLNQVFRWGSSRLSLKVDFNFFNSARSFRGLKKVNLNNGFNDPTLLRETLAYELFDAMGVATPRTSFVDLWVNDTHLGLYTMVEQVDKTFVGRQFARDDGNLYKPEMPAAYLNWTKEDLEEQRAGMGMAAMSQELVQQISLGGAKLVDIIAALQQQAGSEQEAAASERSRMTPPERERGDMTQRSGLKTNEAYPDHSALLRFLEVLNNEPDETFPEEIEKVLDVDGALRFIAVAATVGYFDSYLGMGHNYYLYEVDGYFTIIPWDLNGSFGAFSGGMSRDEIINFYIDEPTAGPIAQRPLIDRLLSHEPYREVYHRYLRELIGGPFALDAMASRIEELAGLIRPYVEADELKFFSTEDFQRGLSEDVSRRAMGAGMAGPTPQRPPLPRLSPASLACLRSKMNGDTFEELRSRQPTPDELAVLESCLTREEMRALLAPLPGQRPPAPPPISEEALACLRSGLDEATLEELRTRRPTMQELSRLRSCLSQEEVAVFLRQGPAPQGRAEAGPPTAGGSFIGLKTFVAERGESIRQQLEGARPSAGDGSGNGGDPARFN